LLSISGRPFKAAFTISSIQKKKIRVNLSAFLSCAPAVVFRHFSSKECKGMAAELAHTAPESDLSKSKRSERRLQVESRPVFRYNRKCLE